MKSVKKKSPESLKGLGKEKGNRESITSFCDRFTEAANAYRIFFELTEKQEMVKFITKLRVGNQKQLKLLRIEKDCIEDIFDVIETFET
jgi:hypothetical protein